MSKVDTERLKKRTRSSRQPKKKALTYDAAVRQVKGTSDPPKPRWILHALGEAEPLKLAMPDGKTVTVFVAERVHFAARSVVRIFLSRCGFQYYELDRYELNAYAPNGWTPAHVIVLTPVDGGRDYAEERFDLEALKEQL